VNYDWTGRRDAPILGSLGKETDMVVLIFAVIVIISTLMGRAIARAFGWN
jgi:hypothetical protein